jgi:hypothetical protein
MPAARCVLCGRLLMGLPLPVDAAVANPDALVLCMVCEALPPAERRERRRQIMMRMLEDAVTQRRRHA